MPVCSEDVLDDEALNLCFELHTELVQFDDGTQRSEEPAVSLWSDGAALSVQILLTVEVNEEVLCWGADGNVSSPFQITVFINGRLFLPLLVVSSTGIVCARSLDLSTLQHIQKNLIQGYCNNIAYLVHATWVVVLQVDHVLPMFAFA